MLYSNCCNAPDRIIRKLLDMHFSEQGVCPQCLEMCSFIEYKPYPLSDNYEIGNDGSVWSLNYAKKKIRKELRAATTKKGYKAVSLAINRKDVPMLVHRLVAITFIPNPENKKEVNHKNGITDDNRLENLEWVTRSENILHSYRDNGREWYRGESNPKAKVSKADVIEIRRLRANGVARKEVASNYGISQTMVSYITSPKYWRSLNLSQEEVIDMLLCVTNRKTDLISITIRKAIRDSEPHMSLFEYIKSQAKDNVRMMEEVIGIELTNKILAL
jgi:predicted transcriptional regulator